MPLRPAADTVSAFFACLLAQRWEDAVSLLRPEAVEEFREAYLTHAYGVLDLPAEGDGGLKGDQLRRLAVQPAPPKLRVANIAGLFALPAPVLLERIIRIYCSTAKGGVALPWFATRVEILGERLVLEGVAEVTFAYVDQPPDEVDEGAARDYQRPRAIRLMHDGRHWRMDLPAGLVPQGM